MISAAYAEVSIQNVLIGAAFTQNQRASRVFIDDRVGSMATHIVEGLNSSVFPQDEDNGEAGNVKAKIISGFVETSSVHYQNP